MVSHSFITSSSPMTVPATRPTRKSETSGGENCSIMVAAFAIDGGNVRSLRSRKKRERAKTRRVSVQ